MCCGKRQSEEVRAVRNGLMLVACLPPGTRVTSGSGLLPKAILGLWQLDYMLASMIHVATKATGMPRMWTIIHVPCGFCGLFCHQSHENINGLCCYL